jgi:hypothetical protein
VFSLDDPLFDRNEPDAVRLIELLADLYTSVGETTGFVAPWIKQIDIYSGKTPRDRWDDLVEKLAKRHQLRACVQAAYVQYKGNPQAKFLENLLQQSRYGDDEGAAFDPTEFIGLFDRATERNLLRVGLLALAKPPFSPIVIGILAEREDEPDFFVRAASAELLGRFLGTTGASQDRDPIDWSDLRVDAETEIRNIAENKSVGGFTMKGESLEEIDEVIARLGPALGSRTATLEITTRHLAMDPTRTKLKEFVGYWRRFAAQPRPPVLYIIVVRYDNADPSPAELEPKLAEVLAEAGCKPLTPITLSECEPRHFPPWRDAVARQGRKFNEDRYLKFTQSFGARFRLRELMLRLGQPQSRIYS